MNQQLRLLSVSNFIFKYEVRRRLTAPALIEIYTTFIPKDFGVHSWLGILVIVTVRPPELGPQPIMLHSNVVHDNGRHCDVYRG